MEQMTVQHEFEHETHDGPLVSVKPDETYLLLTRTNEHRWYVRTKQEDTTPIHIPAQYVRNAQGDSCQFSTFGVCDAKAEVTPERRAHEGGDAPHDKVEMTIRTDEEDLSPTCDAIATPKVGPHSCIRAGCII